MTPTETTAAPAAELVNELYWHSDQTVDEIARELHVGRSTLYASLHPVDAGTPCPECGEAMVFTNRSNREAGVAICPVCTTEARVEVDHAARPAGDDAAAASDGDGGARWRREIASVSPQRAALVGGGAALGLMVGAAAGKILREMR